MFRELRSAISYKVSSFTCSRRTRNSWKFKHSLIGFFNGPARIDRGILHTQPNEITRCPLYWLIVRKRCHILASSRCTVHRNVSTYAGPNETALPLPSMAAVSKSRLPSISRLRATVSLILALSSPIPGVYHIHSGNPKPKVPITAESI